MKGPNPNTKSNLKESNIYPGVNPSTKTPNECSSLSFVSVFPQLKEENPLTLYKNKILEICCKYDFLLLHYLQFIILLQFYPKSER